MVNLAIQGLITFTGHDMSGVFYKQDVAITANPDETVGKLVERLLVRKAMYGGQDTVINDAVISIRASRADA